MLSIAKLQETLSVILMVGILVSAGLVLLGGTLYLLQSGNENMHMEILQPNTYQISVKQIVLGALFFSPIHIIELGLLLLVITQVLRIALLVWFYTMIQDYWFILFSVFILLALIYSLLWRN